MSDVDKLKKEFAPNNGRFKILNDSGFSDFIGVLKTSNGHFNMVEHILDNGDSIKTTLDHELIDINFNPICAGDVNSETELYGINGVIKSIDKKYSVNDTVYDILHVYKDNRHYVSELLINQCLYIDEIAFIPNVEEFYESVFPTISSSNKTKVIITSTPLGMNYFYKMWVEAETGRSAYVPYDVKWYEHPERDQKWYDTMCASMSPTAIEQEMNCVSGDTLIDINGEKVQIEQLYNKFNKSTDNVIAYVNDINICVD